MSSGEENRPRICPLFEDEAARQQIADAVESHDSLQLVEPGPDLDAVDVLVLDAEALRTHRETLVARKAAAEPVLLPTLLVLPEGDSDLGGPEAKPLVDEVLAAPLAPSKVHWRIETLLRLRRQSIESYDRGRDFHSVFENVRDAIAIVDPTGQVTRVNQAFTDLFGYDSQTVAGRQAAAVFEREADFEAVVGAIESAPDAGKLTRTLEFETADGHTFLGETTITRVREESGATGEFIAVIRDVSERVERKRRLRQYEYAVEGATDMLAAADPEGNLLFANERYREFHGLDRGGVQGTPLESVLDETAHERLQSRFDRVLDGKRVQFEMERIRTDGKSRRIESLLSPMRDEQGEIVGVVAAIRDITERQQHLDEIRRLSEYRRVVSAVNHRLVSADLDSDVLPEITDVVASSDRFGCTFLALVENGEAEFVCHEGADLGDAEVAAIHTPEYLDRVFEAGTLWIEDVTEPPEDQHVDDPPSHSGVAIAIQHDDRRYGVLTVHFPPEQAPRDVEIELLEELAGDIGLALHDRELAQRLATFREIVQRIEDPIMLQDRAGEFEVVNEALSGYADMTPAELQGRDEFAFMDDETATQIANRKDEVVREGEPQTYEVTPRFPTQGDRAFHTTRYPHYDEDGEIDGTVAICRDVTDIRERERQLRVFDRVLRHNLHNEMNIVLGHAETIAESAEGELAAAADRITAAGEELVKLADKERRIVELLERNESCQDVDVCESLRAVITDVQEAHPDAAITLDCRADLGATATPCLGDAFREVLENAVVHSEGRAEVSVRVRREGDTVTVEFADNGPGIPEMERQVLEGKEITPLIHGSGLGLWLVSHVVAESGGSLAFHENDPQGSIVEISVPLA